MPARSGLSTNLGETCDSRSRKHSQMHQVPTWLPIVRPARTKPHYTSSRDARPIGSRAEKRNTRRPIQAVRGRRRRRALGAALEAELTRYPALPTLRGRLAPDAGRYRVRAVRDGSRAAASASWLLAVREVGGCTTSRVASGHTTHLTPPPRTATPLSASPRPSDLGNGHAATPRTVPRRGRVQDATPNSRVKEYFLLSPPSSRAEAHLATSRSTRIGIVGGLVGIGADHGRVLLMTVAG